MHGVPQSELLLNKLYHNFIPDVEKRGLFETAYRCPVEHMLVCLDVLDVVNISAATVAYRSE